MADAIGELGIGEALVSLLDEKGMPAPVERAWILPPQSQLAPLSDTERNAAFQADILYPHYKDAVDNFSAYEALQQFEAEQAQQAAAQAEAQAGQKSATKAESKSEAQSGGGIVGGFLGGLFGSRKKSNQGMAYDLADSVGDQINKQITRTISRSVMGVIKNMLK